jgi:hypothetical protein
MRVAEAVSVRAASLPGRLAAVTIIAAAALRESLKKEVRE